MLAWLLLYVMCIPAPVLASPLPPRDAYRYQLIGGLDRYLFSHSNFLWSYLGISGLTRMVGMAVGEASRPWWQGLPPPGSRKVTRTRRVSKKVQRRVPRSALTAAGAPALAAAAAAAASPVVEAVSMGEGEASTSYAAEAVSPVELEMQVEGASYSAASPYGQYSGRTYNEDQYALSAEAPASAQQLAQLQPAQAGSL